MTAAGPAPPAVGVKVNVAAAPALAATRSAAAMAIVTEVAAPPMIPDATAVDAVGSALVCTVTEVLPAVAAPIVRPASVTVTAVLAASAVPPAVMTMDVAPGAPGASVAPPVESVAVGVGVMAKKPDG